jgi:integrase
MKVSRFESRNCWRVQVPARWSDDRKPYARYFKTKEEGNAFIAAKYNRPASNHSVRMPQGDQFFLEEMRAKLGSNDAIRQAVDFYQKTVLSVQKHGTVFQMVGEYQAWQETMNRTLDGSKAINHWAGRFEQAFGNEMVTAMNYSGLSKWINSHPGGKGHSGRRNAYVFAHALLNWAQKNGWLAQDILKGMDKPGVNVLKNIMPVANFEKILRACAASDEFRSILPVLVLRGLAGVRDCELVGKRVNQTDVIYWSDFNWTKGWLFIRDEVAKQTTRKSGDQRWVVLSPAALAWLKPLARASGPVYAGNRDTFGEIKKAMLKVAKLKMERNTLRHSFATYSITCGSLAEAAKNMGDTEARVKATYENPNIEPETGLAWFALRPQGPGNVIQMGTAA